MLSGYLHDNPAFNLGHVALLVVEVQPHALRLDLVLESEDVLSLQWEVFFDVREAYFINSFWNPKSVGNRKLIFILWNIIEDKC